MYLKCAFTGHRVLDKNFNIEELESTVLKLIEDGTEQFLCGMALGFDTCCAETVLKFREQYGVKIIAVLPCADQARKFPPRAKQKYEEILTRCDEVITLSENYYQGCMFARDRYLVDNCDVLVSYLRRQSGGTYYTVSYAKKIGRELIEL